MRDLNIEASNKLETLLKTEPTSLTEPDIEFLKARSSYLSDEQREMLKRFDTAKKEATEEENKKANYSSLNKPDLQKVLQDRNIVFEEAHTKPVLIAMLEQSDAGMTPHIVTEEDLETNTELASQGVKVGEVIGLPVEEK